MSRWAWVWLGALALFGWAPALAVSYVLAYWFGVMSGRGPEAFLVAYAILTAVALLLMVQVRHFFSNAGRAEATWFIWGGGSLLAGIWGGALVVLARSAWGY